ncbi:hypothetical protein AVEN_32648-1 [Araneus ventricosus]|uniref:Uncharacterized protein n=1 Tax=Araneus ventricosus TaxID=182803 RepID=A0A4Y2C8V4_ARAVE|nr:hypothetical protein AVEN_32648-1 [Araneus ventricosus]
MVRKLYSDKLTRGVVMNSTFVPTLEDIAVKTVALLFYNDPKISQLSECEPFDDPTTEWNDLIYEKVSKLFLPALLQKRLLATSISDCLWIARYYALHQKYPSICCNQCRCLERILLHSYLRPSNGLFDKHKFFDDLVRDQLLDVKFRFILACEFFTTLEITDCHSLIWKCVPHIHGLWKQMGLDMRNCFYRGHPYKMKWIASFITSHCDWVFEDLRDLFCPDYVPLVV